MAQQGGILGLRGTVGGLVFARDGSVRQKPAARPVTAMRTLENNAEFGAAAAAGKMLRNAMRAVSQAVRGAGLVGRLAAAMKQIINLDSAADRGLRQVLKANIGALLGFNFSDTSLSAVLFAPFTVGYGTGATANSVLVTIPSLTPTNDLSVPQGATHFQIVAASAQINFATGETVLSTQTLDAPTAIGAVDVAPGVLELEFGAAAAAGASTVVAVGVVYYQEVNGSFYALNNTAANALTVVYAA